MSQFFQGLPLDQRAAASALSAQLAASAAAAAAITASAAATAAATATSGVADGFNAQTWANGFLAVTALASARRHLEDITVTLPAGAATLTVDDGDTSTRAAGNRLDLKFRLPPTAHIVITIKNTAGDTLETIDTDATGDDCLVELYHDGAKWNHYRSTYPI